MELLVKTAGIIAAVAASYKIINELIYNRKSKLREEYEFVKTYLEDIQNKELHKYIIEKGYLAISGKLLKSEEIKYLLKFSFPSYAFSCIHYALKHIEYNQSNEAYKYRENFTNKYKRLAWEWWFFSTYFIFAFIAFSPLFFGSILQVKVNFQSVVIATLFSISFIILAIAQLGEYRKISSAKYILEEQDKIHTQST